MPEDLVGKRQNKKNWFHVGMLGLWRQAKSLEPSVQTSRSGPRRL